ncbi:sugar transferase [Pseudonocardia kunmingensis]|uniref:sugar transferase n=1 Tax=Pseudonocardia kunmingensis TaxID=630975 RepID=UPI0011541FAE|nr:sugar transferase [Pseudonocardia kunmingensis]
MPLPRPPEHDTGPVTVPAPRRAPEQWQGRYAAAVSTTDVALLVLCLGTGALLGITTLEGPGERAHLVAGVVAAALLVIGLAATRAWEPRVLGNGSAELRRVLRAVTGSAGALGLAGLALQVDSVRPWVFLVLPLYGVLALSARYCWRRWLHHQRHHDRCVLPVLVVGSDDAVADLIHRTRRDRHFGWSVEGVCTPTGAGPGGAAHVEGVPVVGDLSSVNGAVRASGYRVVAVAPSPGWGPRRLHELAWQLEGTQTELVVNPGLMEIAGPRMHITPVDGMPLVRLTQPNFSGGHRILKNAVDRLGAAVAIVLVAPLLLAIALAVRSDGGPAFFLQERVGVGGSRFRMVKFRSMRVDADREVARLAAANEGAGPLFKMRQDPRVTRVGAVLRRYSLDELPQLFNVLTGAMSLVGPRPPLPREVEAYGDDARRRLLVRPGMTGLWQVSGRSELSWEETVRLDLRYVENWSITLDFMILWKTVNAVTRGRGAY